MKATASYSPTKWDEKSYEQVSSTMKLTRASVEFAFSGQIDGHGLVEYLMCYTYFDEHDPHKSTASYVGLIRFKGKLNGKAGTITMEDRGAFENSVAKSALTIIADSGTEGLKGITGTGTYVATPKACKCELNYELK